MTGNGGHKYAWWLFHSIGYMDFNKDILLDESLVIYKELNGFFNRIEIENMDFDFYEKIIKKIKILRKTSSGG